MLWSGCRATVSSVVSGSKASCAASMIDGGVRLGRRHAGGKGVRTESREPAERRSAPLTWWTIVFVPLFSFPPLLDKIVDDEASNEKDDEGHNA